VYNVAAIAAQLANCIVASRCASTNKNTSCSLFNKLAFLVI